MNYVLVTYAAYSRTPVSVPIIVPDHRILECQRRPGSTVTLTVIVKETQEEIQVDARDVFAIDEGLAALYTN